MALTKPLVESVTPEGRQEMKIKLLMALIPLTICMIIATGAVYAYDKIDEVKFADPIVESSVRDALGKPSGTIHKDDFEKLRYLTIYGRPGGIIDLSGLEHLSELKQLTIFHTDVSDFSPLSGLTNFQSVHFDSCWIADFSTLSTLPNLNSLSLDRCQLNENDLSSIQA